ncbi:MAG: TrbI/VirB10 family protein [Phenylobacterium sp.]
MGANRSKSAGQELSEVLEAAPSRMPKVRSPDSPLVFWGGMGGAVLAGLLVFNGMNTARGARAQTPPPPPAETPAPPAPAAQPVPMPSASPAPPPPPAMPVPQAMSEDAYLRSPTLVVDLAPPDAGAAQAAQPTTASSPAPGEGPGTAEERFAARTLGTGQGAAQAVQMRDLSRTVPQGVLIAAVLESAINSDLPGAVRGVVSRDVRSFDGDRVLIPRGSRLIGQYKSAATLGQTRAFVVWNRIITPAGISIDIASPAVDRLGRGGVEGDVDTHFLQRYGGAILLTVLNAGVTAAVNAGSNSGSNTLVLGFPGQVGQAVTGGGVTRDIPATLRVPQGAAIQVFVARDLDFSSVIR